MISRSSFDLPTVLDTLVRSAVRICHASNGNIARVNGDRLQFVAFSDAQADYRDYMKSLRLQVDRGSISGRAVLEGRIVHIHDVLADPEFTMFAAQKHGGFRTGVSVPLMHEGTRSGLFPDASHGGSIHPQADRAACHFRRPGGHRNRERAAVRGGTTAHARFRRDAGPADRRLRGATRHLEFARRAGARVRGHAGERDSHLRGQVRNSLAVRGRRLSLRFATQRTGCVCRSVPQPTSRASRSGHGPSPRR